MGLAFVSIQPVCVFWFNPFNPFIFKVIIGLPRGMGWGGRREGVSGWGTHVNPWLIHVNVWQKPLQYCKVISLQLIKINEKNKVIIDIYVPIVIFLIVLGLFL